MAFLNETINLSVIICCYNSALRLPETLRHLSLQQTKISWELIVVDNNCTDNTVEVAQTLWSSYATHIPLVLVKQPIAGLSYARQKGIEIAKGEVIVFCDDDNWLCDTYLQTAYDLMQRLPNVGIIGGCGEEVCEIVPPTWFEGVKASYAIGQQAEKSGYINFKERHWGVYGAGMVIRKTCLEKIKQINFASLLSDRKGKELSSGGDSELCYVVRFLGYDIYYEDTLRFKHFIPKGRLTDDYLYRMSLGFLYATTLTLYRYVAEQSRELKIKPLWLWDFSRISFHAVKNFLLDKNYKFPELKSRLQLAFHIFKQGYAYDSTLKQIQDLYFRAKKLDVSATQ